MEEDLQAPLQAGTLSPGIGVCMLLLRKDLFDGHRDFNHIVDKKVIVDRLQSYGCVHKQQVIAIKHKVDKHVCVHVHVCACANACRAITDRLCRANRNHQ